jgi:hypothetical protein
MPPDVINRADATTVYPCANPSSHTQISETTSFSTHNGKYGNLVQLSSPADFIDKSNEGKLASAVNTSTRNLSKPRSD